MLPLFGSKCFTLGLCFYAFTITGFASFSAAKPTKSNVNSEESARLLVQAVHPSPRISISAEESEQARPRSAEGVWQGSARLPSTAKSGGNENSRTKTDDLTSGRTIDFFPPNRQRHNRRLNKLDGGSSKQEPLDDADFEANDGGPLVQSLTAMASHLIDDGEESQENSSEKDIYIEGNGDNPEADTADEQQQADQEQSDLEDVEQETPADEPQVDEPHAEALSKPTSESKTLTTLTMIGPNPASWYDEAAGVTRSTTTPKGLTTWSAVNGGAPSFSHQQHMNHNNNGFKGTVQKMPSDYTVSGMLAFQQQQQQQNAGTSTTLKPYTSSIITAPTTPASPTTELARTTKINTSMMGLRRKKPNVYNRFKPKGTKPNKFVKPQLEEVVATKISSDDTHNTFQLVTSSEIKTTEEYGNRFTKKPYQPWPINPPLTLATTPRTVTKKSPFTRITKKPYPYQMKVTNRIPSFSLTTPTTTTPASTTVYLRNPGPLIQAFPLSLTNLPFLDFVRSQILPRIGLTLLSFMATSPLLLSLLGAGAISVGRKKRDADEVTYDKTQRFYMTPYEISKLLLAGEKDFSKVVKKDSVTPEVKKPAAADTSLTVVTFSTPFTQILQRLFTNGITETTSAKAKTK